MNNIFLLEQNKSIKLSFEKEVNSIEFTETIANMDSNLNYDQKKRDIYLLEYGKELFEKYPSCNEKYPSLNIVHEPLSQEEIDNLLTPIGSTDDHPYHKKITKKIRRIYENICDWFINHGIINFLSIFLLTF